MREVVPSIILAALAIVSLRRLVLLAAALRRPRPTPTGSHDLPVVTVVVPARNEATVAQRLLDALERLRYPSGRCSILLVCNGCTDDTPSIFRQWAAKQPYTDVLELPVAGKASAINAALGAASGDLIVVLDADMIPAPDMLEDLAHAFADPAVGAAAPYVRPANQDQNLVSRYAAIAAWVHQLVTSAGLDRLGLNPST